MSAGRATCSRFAIAATARPPSLSARSIASVVVGEQQIVLRREVPIEPPVGQAGVFHEIGHADAVDSGLPEARGRHLHDAIVAFSLVRL